MRKLAIILAIAIMLFATQEQLAEQPAMLDTLHNAASEQTEKVQEANTERVDKTAEATCEPMPTEATKEETAVQEIPTNESAKAIDKPKVKESEETVKCVDQGDQSLAEYKSQPSGQPNPFENAPPADIVDHPVEDLIGEGEDRPGEGKHF